jgi:hypothetical protein
MSGHLAEDHRGPLFRGGCQHDESFERTGVHTRLMANTTDGAQTGSNAITEIVRQQTHRTYPRP